MDRAVAQANKTGQADYVMKTEIEHLRRDLYEIILFLSKYSTHYYYVDKEVKI